MVAIIAANNARSTLAGPIGPSATSCAVASGDGNLFPSPSAGQVFRMTFVSASDPNLREIVSVTNRSGDVMTIQRAQEGTAAQSWLAGDKAANLMTSGTLASFPQLVDLQHQLTNFGIDSGSANAVAIGLSPTPAVYSDIEGAPIRIFKGGSPNTAGVTVNINGIGATPLLNPGGAALWSGELPGNVLFECVYDGTNFILTSPPKLPLNLNLGVTGKIPLANSNVQLIGEFSTPGTSSFTFPANTFAVYVKVTGGGGGGAGTNAGSVWSGGGGGGGGHAEGWVTGNPGDVVTVTTGAAGAGGVDAGTGANGGNAGTSSFGSAVTATAGQGGHSVSNVAGGLPGQGTTVGTGIGVYGGYGGSGAEGPANTIPGGHGGSTYWGGGIYSNQNNAFPSVTAAWGSGGGGAWGTGNCTGVGGISGLVLVYG